MLGRRVLKKPSLLLDRSELGVALINDQVLHRVPDALVRDLNHLLPLRARSEEHTSELQSRLHLVCRLLLEKKKKKNKTFTECERIYRVERVRCCHHDLNTTYD